MLVFGGSRESDRGLFSYRFIYSSRVGCWIGISLPLLAECFLLGKMSTGELLVFVFFMKTRLNFPYFRFINAGAISFALTLFK